jgi:hypothetical protein
MSFKSIKFQKNDYVNRFFELNWIWIEKKNFIFDCNFLNIFFEIGMHIYNLVISNAWTIWNIIVIYIFLYFLNRHLIVNTEI